eukprot:978291_1
MRVAMRLWIREHRKFQEISKFKEIVKVGFKRKLLQRWGELTTELQNKRLEFRTRLEQRRLMVLGRTFHKWKHKLSAKHELVEFIKLRRACELERVFYAWLTDATERRVERKKINRLRAKLRQPRQTVTSSRDLSISEISQSPILRSQLDTPEGLSELSEISLRRDSLVCSQIRLGSQIREKSEDQLGSLIEGGSIINDGSQLFRGSELTCDSQIHATYGSSVVGEDGQMRSLFEIASECIVHWRLWKKRATFGRWRIFAREEASDRAHMHTAVVHCVNRSFRATVRLWRRKVDTVRMTMSAESLYCINLTALSFMTWYSGFNARRAARLQTVQASELQRTNTLQRAWRSWVANAEHTVTVREKFARICSSSRASLLSSCMFEWRCARRHVRRMVRHLAEADVTYAESLARAALLAWKEMFFVSRSKREACRVILDVSVGFSKRKLFSGWRFIARYESWVDSQISSFSKRTDSRCVKRAFEYWQVAADVSRELKEIGDTFQYSRLTFACFEQWKDSFNHSQTETNMLAKSTLFQESTANDLVREIFGQWHYHVSVDRVLHDRFIYFQLQVQRKNMFLAWGNYAHTRKVSITHWWHRTCTSTISHWRACVIWRVRVDTALIEWKQYIQRRRVVVSVRQWMGHVRTKKRTILRASQLLSGRHGVMLGSSVPAGLLAVREGPPKKKKKKTFEVIQCPTRTRASFFRLWKELFSLRINACRSVETFWKRSYLSAWRNFASTTVHLRRAFRAASHAHQRAAELEVFAHWSALFADRRHKGELADRMGTRNRRRYFRSRIVAWSQFASRSASIRHAFHTVNDRRRHRLLSDHFTLWDDTLSLLLSIEPMYEQCEELVSTQIRRRYLAEWREARERRAEFLDVMGAVRRDWDRKEMKAAWVEWTDQFHMSQTLNEKSRQVGKKSSQKIV